MQRVDAIAGHDLLTLPASDLVDASRQRTAQAVVERQRPLFFASAALQILVLGWLWQSGRAARLRDAMRRRIRNVHALRAGYVATLALLAGAATAPVAFVAYRIAVDTGLSTQTPLGWALHDVVLLALDALVASFVFTVLLALVGRTHLWYLFGTAFLFALFVGLAFVEPPTFGSWLEGQAAVAPARVAAIAQSAGVTGVPIVVDRGGWESRADVGHVEGFGPTTRIVLPKELLDRSDPRELAFMIAHAAYHVRHGDVWRLILFGTTCLVLAGAIAVSISDRIGFRRDDDPLSRLALLGALLGVVLLAFYPAVNTLSRRFEAEADRSAIELTRDPAPAVRLMLALADVNLLPLCPPRLVRAYFLTNPPLGTRIATIRAEPDPCP